MDIIPWESALQTLMFRQVVGDEMMHDYTNHQAYRSVAHAFAGSGDGLKLIDGLCRAARNEWPSRAVASFLLARLVLEEGSSHGEGNQVPECKSLAPLVLRSYAAARLHPTPNASTTSSAILDRRVVVGFMLLIRDAVRRLIDWCRRERGTFLVSIAPEFVAETLQLSAMLSLHAEGHWDAAHAARATSTGGVEGASVTRLTHEANVTLVSVVHSLLGDVMEADTAPSEDAATKKKRVRSPMVVDTSVQSLMWEAASKVQAALRRHDKWLRRDADRARDAARREWLQLSAPKGSGHERWYLSDLLQVWDTLCLTELRKTMDRYEILHGDAVRTFGSTECRHAQELRDAQWNLTIRMSIAVCAACRGYLRVYCSEGDGALTTSEALTLAGTAVADHVASPDALAIEGEASSSGPTSSAAAFSATIGLLSALSYVLFTSPMDAQQEAMCRSKPQLAAALHQDLVKKALRYKDPLVVRLGTLLSSCILRATAMTSANGGSDSGAWLDAGGGDALLELLESDSTGTAAVDGATTGAIEIAVMAAIARPHAVVPSLFKLFKHRQQGTSAKRNALEVIAALPRQIAMTVQTLNSEIQWLEEGTAAVGSSSNHEARRQLRVSRSKRDQLDDVLRVLSEHLLEMIHEDEEVEQRMHAAALFEMVKPSLVMQPLLVALLQRDGTGRRRAAATRALNACLLRHASVEAAEKLCQGVAASTSTVAAPEHVALEGVKEMLRVAVSLYEAQLPTVLPPARALNSAASGKEGAPSSPQGTRSALASISPADLVRQAQLGTLPTDTWMEEGDTTSPMAPTESEKRRVMRQKLLLVCTKGVETWASRWTHDESILSQPGDRRASVLRGAWAYFASFYEGQEEDTREVAERSLVTPVEVDEVRQMLAIKCGTALASTLASCSSHLGAIQAALIGASLGLLETSASVKDAAKQPFGLVFALVSLKLLLSGYSTTSTPGDDAQTSTAATLLRIFFGVIPEERGAPRITDDNLRRLALDVLMQLPCSTVMRLLRVGDLLDGLTGADLHASLTTRVFLFVMSAQLARRGLQRDAFTTDEDRDGVIQAYHEKMLPLLRQFREMMLAANGWHHSDPKLHLACMESAALVITLGLPGAPVGIALGDGGGIGSDVTESFTLSPLRNLTGLLSSDGGFLRSSRPSALIEEIHFMECPSVPAVVVVDASHVHQALLALETVAAGIRIVRQQPHHPSLSRAEQWTAVWGRNYISAITGTANACVKTLATDGSTSHHQPLLAIAIKCIETLFTFLVWRPSAPLHQRQDTDIGRTPMVLEPEDEAALVSFAVGCLQYERQVEIQHEGVKLASAVMAVLVPAWQPSAESAARLENLVTLLSKVARMHPIAECRRLAEAVLDTIGVDDNGGGGK